jgi:hypothetical protein
MRPLPKGSTEVDLVREIVRHAYWDVRYYEQCLDEAHQKVAITRAVVAQCNTFKIDIDEITPDDEMEDEDVKNAEELLTNLVAEALGSVERREASLRQAHTWMAAVKALLARINFAEIDVDKIRDAVIAELGKKEKKQ